jgi:Ca-activated chloride channel homolog
MAGLKIRSIGRLLAAVVCCSGIAHPQEKSDPGQLSTDYRLQLPVDEVVLTFHAEDAQGLPVRDLTQDEIKLWDNGRAPRRIVSFASMMDRPLRGGILVDISESMQPVLVRSKALAEQSVERLFGQKFDQAFVADFAFWSENAEPWSSNASKLEQSIRSLGPRRMAAGAGTALFAAIFRACFYDFGQLDPGATGNFILLFSDGEDNAGQTSLDEALSACQRSNTAIYAFQWRPTPGQDSTGPRILHELADKSGGRVFAIDQEQDVIQRDLETVETEMRNQYRLVYNPVNLRHDGSFHRIEIQPPDRVKRVEVRTGYYAPRSSAGR